MKKETRDKKREKRQTESETRVDRFDSHSQKENNVFDPNLIEQLVALMKENDLTEVNLTRGSMGIQLRRGPVAAVPQPVALPTAAPVLPASPAVAKSAPEVAAPKEDDAPYMKEILSPMIGTFYTSSNPDKPPFVKVGDTVGPETTVCIIEAMKVFNEIAAEMSGKIVSILVPNGSPVEYNTPLFKIDTRG